MSCLSDRNPLTFPPSPFSSIPPRNLSAPLVPSQPLTTNSTHDHYSNGQGSLLPMPPNYTEGSCWTLASVRCLHSSPAETRPRTSTVQVSKISLRMDGRWAEEKPYTLEKTWDEWVDFRDRLISRYPEIESILPKLSKGQGFLESIFTNSKRNQSTQITNTKELNYFLDCLVGKCPKKVLQSNITQVFLQTEPMIAGDHQVEYVDDDLPLCRIPLAADIPRRDEGAVISSHLQAFRFPGPKPAPQPQQHQQAPPPHLLSSPLSNFSVRQMSLASDVEKPIVTSEKLSPHTRRRRPTLDPSMTAIVERSPLTPLPPPPPPPGSVTDLNSTVVRSATIGRTLAAPTSRLANKLRNPMRPNTGLAVQSSNSSPSHPKRPSTSDPRLHHGGMLMPPIGGNLKTVCSPPPRRPSELLPGLSEQPKLPRPRLREFKSMQDIRATALGKPSVGGRSGRHGVADSSRNNSAPTEGETPQLLLQLRSPATSSWERHWRTPSDSSSSFGSSQLSPISSVLSSPTVAPLTPSNLISKPVTNRPKLVCRHSVDSLGPNSMTFSGVTPSSIVAPVQETRKTSSSGAHSRQAPVAPFYAIPPRSHPPAAVGSTKGSQKAGSPASKRPHTSADNANGLMKPSSLILKVLHPESKTNIILAVQKGLFSLPQIRAKIQNKLLIAADILLPHHWKITLSMIDQAPFVRPEGKGLHEILDDGSMLLELINAKSSDLKKITLRIS